jgi:hypothetical protein
MDGTYGFAYTGWTGVGMGVFRVADSRLTGADCFGGIYEGTVRVDPVTGEITATFSMFIPRGLPLVQGASALDFDVTRSVPPVTLPPAFGDGAPVKIPVPPGIVTVMIKRVSDEYVHYANGLSIMTKHSP